MPQSMTPVSRKRLEKRPGQHRLRVRIAGTPAGALLLFALSVTSLAGAQTPSIQPIGGPVPSPRGGTPLPPLTEDAQRLVDQWKQERTALVEQLRFLQQQYRDNGHAEEAAAVAAQIRTMQPRAERAAGMATAELANDGLPTRDDPISMAAFRDRVGETLTFAIRGRDDQQVWGTTTYTDDSALETAAVHAGLLRAGQNALVKVRPLPGQDRYDASERHGVRSAKAGGARGSFRFVSAAVSTPARTSSMTSYRDLVGQSITLPVVGAAGQGAWGTDIYTDDSRLAVAAVHAGAASVGELSYVKVTFLPGQDRYDGSSRNGITSGSYGAYQGSVRIEPAAPAPVRLPDGEDAVPLVLSTIHGRVGASVVVEVTGVAAGSVFGSGPYTDDSAVAVAAVHAGLLKPGETGLIRIVMESGRESYPASTRNGITSQSYGSWTGSIRLERGR